MGMFDFDVDGARNAIARALRFAIPANAEEAQATKNVLADAVKSRVDFATGMFGAAKELATNRNAIVEALARYDERNGPPFDKNASGEKMLADALNAGPSGLLGKIVYHGSPHKFDKFDASKIGTGEGAQAYGHGVYLADSPGVAKSYQEMTPDATAPIRRTFMGKELQQGSPEYHAASLVQNSGKSIQSIRKEVAGWIDEWASKGRPMDAQEVRGWQQTLDLLGSAKSRKDFGILKHEGSLYKADIPDEWIPKMLDWDKPLREQPELVKKQLAPALEWARSKKMITHQDDIGKYSGADGYAALRMMREESLPPGAGLSGSPGWTQKLATEVLQQSGIPGVKYLDGGSRPNLGRISMLEQTLSNLRGKGASKGAIANMQRELDAELARASYNYVVFPGLEDQVKILERNGVPLNALLK